MRSFASVARLTVVVLCSAIAGARSVAAGPTDDKSWARVTEDDRDQDRDR